MRRKAEQTDEELVLQKIRYFCSYQERSVRETEEKLRDWAVQRKRIPGIIRQLREEGYIDEKRFAIAFAGGKFRQNKWGRQKIGFELRLRGLSDKLVIEGIKAIDEEEYLKVLHSLILRKKNELKPENEPVSREKIINFVHGKGYEIDLILAALKELKI